MSRRKRIKYIDGYAVYQPIDSDIVLAHKRSCKLGAIPHPYIKGNGRMIGYLGEIAIQNYLGARARYVGDKEFTHDLVYKKQRIEVKSKMCIRRPDPEYIAFVNGRRGMEPDNDIYFFSRVRQDYRRVYIVGWLPTSTFFDEATFYGEGEYDKHGYHFLLSGYTVPISELNAPKDFKKS
tara:strand:- start:636 stop:1172 length:537 start_codon:yes stop_codon:yes gene_type:complete